MEAWDQLAPESLKWFARFQAYMQMGVNRKIEEVWRQEEIKAGKSLDSIRKRRPPRQWYAASAEYKWKERAELWDADVSRQVREKQRQEVEEMLRRHTNMSLLMQNKVIEALNTMVTPMSVQEAARVFEIAVKIERTSRGVAGEISHVESSDGSATIPPQPIPDAGVYTDAERLGRVRELMERAKRPREAAGRPDRAGELTD